MTSLRIAVTTVLAALVLSLAAGPASPVAAQAPEPDSGVSSSTSTTRHRTLDTTAPLDVDQAPRSSDYDLDKLTGPRHEDSSPGRAAGAPLGVAAVIIFVVGGVAIFRSARSKARAGSRR